MTKSFEPTAFYNTGFETYSTVTVAETGSGMDSIAINPAKAQIDDLACNTDALQVNNQLKIQESMEALKSNLLRANVADGTDTKLDTTGIVKYRAGDSDPESSSTYAYTGSRSIKCVTDASQTGEGFRTSEVVPVTVGETYVFSTYVWAPAGAVINIGIIEGDWSGSAWAQLVGNDGWQRVYKSRTATTSSFWVTVQTEAAQAITFYSDCLKLEKGTTPSTWTPGNILTYNQQNVETDLTGIYQSRLAGTTIERVISDYYKGSASCKATIPAAEGYYGIAIPFTLVIGHTYMLSIAVKANTGKQFHIHSYWMNGPFSLAYKTGNNKWNVYTTTFVATRTSEEVWIVNAYSNQGEYNIYYDDLWVVDITPEDSISISSRVNIDSNNLLTPQQARGTEVNGDTTGFTAYRGTETISSSTEQQKTDYRSLKVITPGSVAYEGFYTASATVLPYTDYVGRIWIRAPLNSSIKVQLSDRGNKVTSVNITGTGDWQYASVLHTTDASTTLSFEILTNATAQAITFYVDDLFLGLAGIEGLQVNSRFTLPETASGVETLQNLVSLQITDTPFKNLFGINSAVAESLTGYASNGVTLSLDSDCYQGNNSIKAVLTSTGWAMVAVPYIPVTPITNYVFSVYTKGTAGKTVYPYVHVQNGGAGEYLFGSGVVLTGNWQRIVYPITTGARAISASAYLWMDGATNDIFHWDAGQFELGTEVTEWSYPGFLDALRFLMTINDIGTGSDEIYNLISLIIQSNNILAPNQAFGTETFGDTTGFTGNKGDEILTSSTEQFHTGSRSLKVVTDGSHTYEGATTTGTSVLPYTKYIVGLWVLAPLGANLRSSLSDNIDLINHVYFTGTGEWQFIVNSITTDAHTSLYVNVRTTTPATAVTFYIDDMMLVTAGIDVLSVLTSLTLPESGFGADGLQNLISLIQDETGASVEGLGINTRLTMDDESNKNKLRPQQATCSLYNSSYGIDRWHSTDILTVSNEKPFDGYEYNMKVSTKANKYGGARINIFRGYGTGTSNLRRFNLNDNVTLSLYVWCPTGAILELSLMQYDFIRAEEVGWIWGDTYYWINHLYEGIGEWERIEVTVPNTRASYQYLAGLCNLDTQDITFYIAKAQVETSDEATEWVYPGFVDSTQVQTRFTLTDDPESVSEELLLRILLELSETSESQDNLQINTQVPVTMGGHFRDTIRMHKWFTLEMAGVGADTIEILKRITAIDEATGVEVIDILNLFAVNDNGISTETLGILNRFQLTEHYFGLDTVTTQQTFTLVDNFISEEIIRWIRTLELDDSGLHSEDVDISTTVVVSEIANIIEDILVRVLIELQDEGFSLEEVISVFLVQYYDVIVTLEKEYDVTVDVDKVVDILISAYRSRVR